MTNVTSSAPSWTFYFYGNPVYYYHDQFSVTAFQYQPCYTVTVQAYYSFSTAPPDTYGSNQTTISSAPSVGWAGMSFGTGATPGQYNYGNFLGYAYVINDYAGTGIYSQTNYLTNYSYFNKYGQM
jgi:hypothetical protein